jgi:class 3 adenylate cyclase/CHAT domain-containing protein
MQKNNDPKTEAKGNIAEILRERERLDKLITEQFRKKRAIVFSDVCGFTQYMDKMGDLRGAAWIQKHHDIVLPLIEAGGGEVLDIMGDGVMASFPDALSATKASIAIQKGLDEYNSKTDESDVIHVKIGINAGEIFVEKGHVAGDVVNVASRIQAQAGADQILVSKSVYEEICGSDEILCRFHANVKVKGKPGPLELYRLIWKEGDVVLSAEPRVRAVGEEISEKISRPQTVLQIEVERDDNQLKISACEQIGGETLTVRQYEDVPVSMDKITNRCRGIIETLNKANRKGRVTLDILVKLREIGQVLSDDFFTQNVKDKIRETNANHLVFNLDDQLVQVPWELLHDGRQFLCQKFSMGRLVRTKQSVIGSGKSRALARPLKMLILADPKGDLKEAYSEGIQIRDYIDHEKDLINTFLQTHNVTADYIRERIRNFDLIHFAGHHDYDQQNPGQSGWRLTNGGFTAQDILRMAGTASMPALIFSNGCQTARTEEWVISNNIQNEIYGLANAFILAGVKHYVGTFWEVLDEPSRRFALEFYQYLLKGLSTGEAVREARLAVIKEYGEETIVWASYLLYGDPVFNYMDQLRTIEAPESLEPSYVPLPETEVRAQEEVIDFAAKPQRKKTPVWLGLGAAITVILAVWFFGYPGLLRENMAEYEKAVLTYYNAGNFEQALKSAEILVEKDPDVRLSYLIQGEVNLRRGDLESAQAAYEKALQASKGSDLQKAKTYLGLGRIASLKKQTDKALNYYQQSTKAAPGNEFGYLSQALLQDELGNPEEALHILDRARKIAPQDRILAAITNETRQKVSLRKDQEKQDRVDELVKELLEKMEQQPRALPSDGLLEKMEQQPRALPSDGWSSRPLTLWIMDFGTQGYSLQEGEDRLVVAGIADNVLQHSRAQLVERALLDKMLAELQLGVSRLADRNTALSLGKILAARLILSGRIIYSGPQTQISMRLIETETGRITAAFTETVGSAVPISVLARKLSDNLVDRLRKLYPLRGKVLNQSGQEVSINVGQNAGVHVGQHFNAANEDVTLEIVSVQPEKSLAKILKGDGAMEEGQRVEVQGSGND